jgi:hypothetical protein
VSSQRGITIVRVRIFHFRNYRCRGLYRRLRKYIYDYFNVSHPQFEFKLNETLAERGA